MLRIAVIGPAGSGKSFLINHIGGFEGLEAAKHGVSASPHTVLEGGKTKKKLTGAGIGAKF